MERTEEQLLRDHVNCRSRFFYVKNFMRFSRAGLRFIKIEYKLAQDSF